MLSNTSQQWVLPKHSEGLNEVTRFCTNLRSLSANSGKALFQKLQDGRDPDLKGALEVVCSHMGMRGQTPWNVAPRGA